MLKVIVYGTAIVSSGTKQEATKAECSTDFAEYYEGPLKLESGFASFRYDPDMDDLLVETVYLIDGDTFEYNDLMDLVDYTQGQWSDGIGEGYEQYPAFGCEGEVYISMWHRGQVARMRIEQ